VEQIYSNLIVLGKDEVVPDGWVVCEVVKFAVPIGTGGKVIEGLGSLFGHVVDILTDEIPEDWEVEDCEFLGCSDDLECRDLILGN
jgi:hypothetical protein